MTDRRCCWTGADNKTPRRGRHCRQRAVADHDYCSWHIAALKKRIAVKTGEWAQEERKPIPSLPGYTATPSGVIIGLKGVPIRQFLNEEGYPRVKIPGVGKIRPVHQLVLEAFVGPRPSPRHETRHLDGCKTNNHFLNLAWGTYADNQADKKRHGTTAAGSKHHAAKLTEADVLTIRAEYKPLAYGGGRGSPSALAARFGVLPNTIRQCATGERWACVKEKN